MIKNCLLISFQLNSRGLWCLFQFFPHHALNLSLPLACVPRIDIFHSTRKCKWAPPVLFFTPYAHFEWKYLDVSGLEPRSSEIASIYPLHPGPFHSSQMNTWRLRPGNFWQGSTLRIFKFGGLLLPRVTKCKGAKDAQKEAYRNKKYKLSHQSNCLPNFCAATKSLMSNESIT